MRKDGAAKHTLHVDVETERDCIDVRLAGIRITIDYWEVNKTFFVGVGSPTDQFSGLDGIPIGELYDALLPLTGKTTK